MSVISFKCPNCDGELIFDPSSGKYKCEYCMSMFSQEELDAMAPAESTEQKQAEEESSAAGDENTAADAQGEGQAVVYTCPSCGAEIVTDATTAATFCYYCHNPVVLGGRLEGKYLPNKVIPFSIDKKEAEKKFLEFVGSKKFVPRAFFNKKQIEKLSGIYFPYWVYDTTLKGNMQAEAKNVRVWRSGETEYTETKIYQVEREGEVDLNNLTENALQKANKQLVEGVLPYNLEEMKDFSMGYLSGFGAEKRDIEKETLADGLKNETRDYAQKLMRDTITGYSSVSVKSSSFNAKKEKFNYVLLPVWTVTYKAHNGKMYYYSMNGQTGKVFGELPVDYKKLSLVSGIVSAVALVLGLIGGFLL